MPARWRSGQDCGRSAEGQLRKVAALRGRVTAKIRALRTGEDWARWLDTAARLPGQTLTNILLIAAQRPGATMVASYPGMAGNGTPSHQG